MIFPPWISRWICSLKMRRTAFFAPMFQVDTRPWYLETHPEVPDSFLCLSQIAHDETWRKAAADYLKAVIRHCEEKYGDRIYGYFILGGGTTEWLSDHDHEEPHPIKEAAYKKYRNDAGATLPTKEELEKDGRVFLESEEENVLCERRFHADTIADLVLYFAAEVQSVIRHQKLLGLYYGYLMELGAPRLYNAGHLGYEKVFFSDDIDMISSPSAYRYRELTDPSAFMVTQKTLDAHNKLYFLEFDHITHVAPSMVEEAPSGNSRNGTLKIIPGAEKRCNNESESLNLMYRDFLLCYANATALWWFDMFDGWFRSEGMMNAVQRMIALHGELSNLSKESVAQIAVYAEGEALYHVRKSAKLANVKYSWGISGILNQNSVNSEFVKWRPRISQPPFFAFFMWDYFPLQGNITIFANITPKNNLPCSFSLFLIVTVGPRQLAASSVNIGAELRSDIDANSCIMNDTAKGLYSCVA